MSQLTENRLRQHITIVGWLQVASNLLFLLIGVFLFFFLSSIGVATRDPEAAVVLSLVGTFVGGLLALLGLPGIVAGFGLLAHKGWARYLAIVLSILNLLNFPVGTVVGAYTLWVLMQEAALPYFEAEQSTAVTSFAHQ